MRLRASIPWTLAAALLLSALSSAPRARAQAGAGPTWYSIDGQPAGTPAQIVIDAAASDATRTVGTLTISGFWVTPKTAPDGSSYNDIQVPGLGNMNQTGAPHLPRATFDVGVVTGAANVTLRATTAPSVYIHGLHLWPEPIEAMYHDGSPEVFQRNDAIYSNDAFWPPDTSSFPVSGNGKFGVLPYATIQCNPFHYDPPQDDTEVHPAYTFTLSHLGTPQLPITVPKSMLSALGGSVINWNQVSPVVARDPIHYVGYFLFICKSADVPTLQPLIDQKKARGFFVSLLDADAVGPSCNGIYLAIRSWYLSTPKNSDHYCILAGNYAELGQCLSPAISGFPDGALSDDSYGAPMAPLMLDKQVMVGRLPYDYAYQLGYEVQNILAYEDNPPPSPHYENVILAAHQGLISGTAIDTWQEDVRNAGYVVAPNFITQYGVEPGVSDASLNANVIGGVGILAYLGHGNSYLWGGWDLGNENYDINSVIQCTDHPRLPIVWSFACETGDISSGASLGEDWVHGYNGAVAFYGATANAWVSPTNDLDKFMFDEVYNHANTIQGYTMAAAESRTEAIHQSGEGWKFLLLGDPQMNIRRYSPLPWYALAPQIQTTICDLGACSGFMVTVQSASGAPVVDAQVSVDFIPAGTPGARARPSTSAQATQTAEIIDDRYTDATGTATVPLPGLTDGSLRWTVQADDGNAVYDTAQVVGGVLAGAGASALGPIRLAAWPTLARTLTRLDFGRPIDADGEVRIFDVAGRRAATLPVRAGESAALWNVATGGSRARPGVYLAELVTNRTLGKCRIVVVR